MEGLAAAAVVVAACSASVKCFANDMFEGMKVSMEVSMFDGVYLVVLRRRWVSCGVVEGDVM